MGGDVVGGRVVAGAVVVGGGVVGGRVVAGAVVVVGGVVVAATFQMSDGLKRPQGRFQFPGG